MRTLLIAAAVLATPLAATAEPKAGDTLVCASKDPAKRLVVVVGLVEAYGPDRVAHITLRNEAPGAVPDVVAHTPVQVAALEAGCPKPADTPRALHPDFEGGLAQWRNAVAHQRGGIFTISPDEIDDMIRQSLPRTGART